MHLDAGDVGIVSSCFALAWSQQGSFPHLLFVFNVVQQGALPLREKARYDA